MSADLSDDSLWQKLSQDLIDGYDEELKLEWEDGHVPPPLERALGEAPAELPRRSYFSELFRLQREPSGYRTGWWPTATRWSSSSRAATPRARAA